jgi:hypothetical protein
MDRVGPPEAHIVQAEVDGQISLYDPSSQRVVVLNTTASDIWHLSDGRHTLEGLVAVLAETYGVEAQTIEQEVRATVNDLIEQGFLPSLDEPRPSP